MTVQGQSWNSADPVVTASGRRRIIVTTALGTWIEYFDFVVYTFLLIYFAPLFFPSENSTTSILAAVAVLGVAYVIRPVGAAFWGWIGDRRGRRVVLTATVALMGVATLGIGLLPTYTTIGMIAPILLVLMRALQGLSASGEAITASTYVLEIAPPRRRGVYSAVVPSFILVGQASGALAAAVLTSVLDPQQMSDYGWRVPFLICAPLTLVVLYLRLRMADSPEYLAIARTDRVARSPLAETLREHWRAIVKVIAVLVAINAPGFVVTVFMVGYLVDTRDFGATTVYTMVGVGLLVAVVPVFLGGRLADGVGRRPVAMGGLLGLVVVAVPCLMVVRDSSSVAAITAAMALLLCLFALVGVIGYVLTAEWFPTRVRLTGSAVSHSLGLVISGGLAPYFTLQMTVWTGSDLAPAFWLVATSAIALVTVVVSRETRGTELPR